MHTKSCTLARTIRQLSLEMVHRAKASHIGSALSISDILAVLYSDVLDFEPNDPDWPDRDRFILSKGHACVAVYAALSQVGFFPAKELENYGRNHSVFMNHISHKVPGVEFSTGSLGHGLPFAVGKALAAKKQLRTWGTFVLLSDGELDEGSNWEAILFSAHHRLDNLVVIIDFNKLQSLTTVEQTLKLEPLAEKFLAFGWNVIEANGHDHMSLRQAFASAAECRQMPSVIIAHTIKGSGVSFMENKVEWHYKSPNDLELEAALSEIKNA